MIYDAHCHLDLMDNMAGFIKEMRSEERRGGKEC